MSFVGVGRICVCPSFPFGIEGGMWDVIVLFPDHCLSIYLEVLENSKSYIQRKEGFTLSQIIDIIK